MTDLAADYLETYSRLCEEKKAFNIRSLRSTLENSIASGTYPEHFKLNGNSTELCHTRINDDYLEIIVTPMRGGGFLRLLDLSYNHIGDRGAKLIGDLLKDDVQLEVLNLVSNNIGSEGAGAIARALHVNDKLHTLNIGDNPLTDDGGMHFAEMLQINTTLRTLHLPHTSLRSTSLIAFSTVLRNNTSLQTLNIANNATHSSSLSQSLQNDTMMHISRMMCLNYTLRNIELAKMGITDWICVEYLSKAIRTNMRLTSLDLSCNRISRDGGVAIFKSIHKHPSLAILKLSNCAVQDEGAEAAAEMIGNNFTLKSLYMDHNAITGKGLIALANSFSKNMSLKQITLWGNKWDTPACEAWTSLLGGPIYSTSYGDDLSGYVSKPGAPFPPNGRKLVMEHAQLSAFKHDAETQAKDHKAQGHPSATSLRLASLQEAATKVPPRLRESDVDVVFYCVEEVLNVAQRELEGDAT
ncbi:hypothetical protein HK097_008553 [Rhizophlyctis rosea]|uniref:Uncharacterized protein n=1 Tax=Rhizophlyctis rosea TaxID=64517 RepID=A0AAD5SDD4_9FUNG|nr:hypothetical protein HK097_008553 [Rhizophlyctis rosea]